MSESNPVLSTAELLSMLAATGDPAALAAVKAHATTEAAERRRVNASAIRALEDEAAADVLTYFLALRGLDDDCPAPVDGRRVRVSFDVSLGGTDDKPTVTCKAGKVRLVGGGGGGGGRARFPDGFKAWLEARVVEAVEADEKVEPYCRQAAADLLSDADCPADLRAIAERVQDCGVGSAIYKIKEALGLVSGRS